MTYVRVVGRVVAILFLLLSRLVAKALLTAQAVTVAQLCSQVVLVIPLIILFLSLARRCVKRGVAVTFVLKLSLSLSSSFSFRLWPGVV